jgi:iron(III) transport system ATP-binding protein
VTTRQQEDDRTPGTGREQGAVMRTSIVPHAEAPPAAPAAGIDLRSVSKVFKDDGGKEIAAVDDVSLTIDRSEFLVLLGPSGCGKTTLLRCLAGLETPTAGRIDIGGRTVYDAARRRGAYADRRIGMVFQSYALWPHMTVAQNVAYPLRSGPRSERTGKAETAERVDELLALMGLQDKADRKPGQLSGGQQQRVALARAIAAGNDVVLFDEPLSNIDAKVRETLRLELREMQRTLGFTAVYVTHDQTEAMELADRIAVMRSGRIVQLGSPTEVYGRPNTRFSAEFVGTSNLLDVTSVDRAEGALPVLGSPLGPVTVGSVPDGDGPFVVASRAHSWWIRTREPASARNAWRGRVLAAANLGWYIEFAVGIGDTVVRIWQDAAAAAHDLVEGAEVWVGVSPENCMVVVDDVR